jgi:molecular chaperone DnaK (HSP70)
MSATNYVVGVDLGTTNIVVSYGESESDSPLQLLPIPQLVAAGQVSSLPMLPALRYHYTQELADNQVALPWATDSINQALPPAVIGKWALDLGSKVPTRLISSAKSWLSHRGAGSGDITLPLNADEHNKVCTPLKVTASYRAYIRAACEHQKPETPFCAQDIVVTVPASFDDIARSLTIEAIKQVGIKYFRLLEEPQAAFYHWLSNNSAAGLAGKQKLFVCDIGGGTSDFTLISITHSNNNILPELERVGVGEHLMLGGDNMDLALAAKAQQKLKGNTKARDLQKLLPQCQKAKESLLSIDAPEEIKLQLSSAGSSLMASTQETRLTAKEVEQMILDGFFPQVTINVKPKQRQTALSDIGLPYPADPAITRHIAAFFQEQQNTHSTEDNDNLEIADVWLLNGGPFLSDKIQQRLQQQMAAWSKQEILCLHNPEPQTSVAHGAAYYARLQLASGLSSDKNTKLIKSTAPRHYFIRVASAQGDKGVCILPKNTGLHDKLALTDQIFNLRCNSQVQFDVASSLDIRDYTLGDSIDWHEKLHALPPLTTTLKGEGQVPVNLVCELDELGVLQIELQQVNAKPSWQLAFNLRKTSDNPNTDDEHRVKKALEVIEQWYGNASKTTPKEPLRKSLEKCLGKRENWSVNAARQLFDRLITLAKRRRRSAGHERSWLNIAGYCLRPGIGFAGDVERIEQVWGLFAQGIQHHQHADVWVQWWAFWRRAAAGLDQQQQLTLFNETKHVLDNNRGPVSKKVKLGAAVEEKLRLIGALERLSLDNKREVLDHIAGELNHNKMADLYCWMAARLLNRRLVYAASEYTMPAQDAEVVLDYLLQQDWKTHAPLGFISASAVRKTLDETLNISEQQFTQVQNKLKNIHSRYLELLHATHTMDQQESQQYWGDALPSGLSI